MNGKIRFLYLATACACLFFSACSVKEYDYSRDEIPGASSRAVAAASAGVAAPSVSAVTASRPAPPSGMTLGQAYVSALNENCYEAFSNARPPQTHALCYRKGAWALSPGIFMSVPQGNTAPYLEPTSPDMRSSL
jgi:hypothetical protein